MTDQTGLGRRGLMRAGGVAGAAALLTATTGTNPARANDQPPVDESFADFTLPKINGNDDSLEKVLKKGSLVGGTSSDWPYSYIDDKTKGWMGIDADILNMVVKMLKIPKLDIQTVTFDGLIPGVLSGRFDIVADSIHYTKARAKVVGFSFPGYYYAETMAVKKGNPLNLHQLSDLKGKRVGTLVGTNYLEWLGDVGVQATPYKEWEQILPELNVGRLDAAIYDQPVVAALIKQHPEWNVEMVSDYIPKTQKNPNGYSRYVLRQGDIQLTSAISAAVEWMEFNGEILKILNKWGLSGYNA